MHQLVGYESGLDALADTAQEHGLEDLRAPSRLRLGQDSVVGDGVGEREPNEPKVVEPLGQDLHELSFASDIVPEKEEHQFEHDPGSTATFPLLPYLPATSS